MQVLPSTVLAVLLILVFVLRGPYRALPFLMASTPFGVTAAFNLPALGGASIMITDIGVAFAFALFLLQRDAAGRGLGTLRPFQPGFFLGLALVLATVSAIVFPRFFANQTEVFGLAHSTDSDVIILIPLHATNGNITQLFRLYLDVIAFLVYATLLRERPDPRLVIVSLAAASILNFALGWLDILAGTSGANVVMELIRTANYSIIKNATMGGLKRMIGGFSEASSFGYYTLGLFGFWLQYWLSGGRWRWTGWVLAGTTLLVLRSTSSSAYVALVILLVLIGAVALMRSLGRTVDRRLMSLILWGVFTLWLALLVLGTAYLLSDPVQAFFNRTLFNKLSSSSGVERMSWNIQALENFLDTAMVGTGIGSMRASNWLLACLGSIGLLGTGLLLAFLGRLFVAPGASDDSETTAVIEGLKAACLATLISALLIVPTPDLGVPFFLFAGLLVGLSRSTEVGSV
ncbi:MAG: hypothetical protein KGN33_07240 [Paracoccaceae bacterium]|nr:hypothetical protein [Paracoccaceae bacterium]